MERCDVSEMTDKGGKSRDSGEDERDEVRRESRRLINL